MNSEIWKGSFDDLYEGVVEEAINMGMLLRPPDTKGGFKIKSFCQNPSAIVDYNPLKVQDYSTTLNLTIISNSNDIFQVKSGKIKDRESAMALKGKLLFAARQKLPQTDDEEYYFTDLLGLRVKTPNNEFYGTVKNVENYGAGTFLEIENNQTLHTKFLPFNKEIIPKIDLTKKYILIEKFPEEY